MFRWFFALCCCLSTAGFAQSVFVPGVLIDRDGTRSAVQIDHRNWEKTPLKILVRDGENTPARWVLVFETGGFELTDGRAFRTRTVQFETSSDGPFEELGNERDLRFEPRVLPLEMLLRGDLVLYKFEERNRIRFFVERGDELLPLVSKPYRAGDQERRNRDFLSVLSREFPRRDFSNADLNKLTLSERSLIEYLTQYAAETDQTVVRVASQRAPIRWSFAAGGGVQTFDPVPVFDRAYTFRRLELTGEPGPLAFRGGGRVEAALPVQQYVWSLLGDVEFSKYRYAEGDDLVLDLSWIGFSPLHVRRYFTGADRPVRPYADTRLLVLVASSEKSVQDGFPLTTLAGFLTTRAGGGSNNVNLKTVPTFLGGVRVAQRWMFELEYAPIGPAALSLDVRVGF